MSFPERALCSGQRGARPYRQTPACSAAGVSPLQALPSAFTRRFQACGGAHKELLPTHGHCWRASARSLQVSWMNLWLLHDGFLLMAPGPMLELSCLTCSQESHVGAATQGSGEGPEESALGIPHCDHQPDTPPLWTFPPSLVRGGDWQIVTPSFKPSS